MNKKSFVPNYKDTNKWKRQKSKEQICLFFCDITDKDIKNADISELQNMLKFCERSLKFLQSETNQISSDENFGGPASQWGFKHHNNIQICKRQIGIIKEQIKKLSQKQK